MATQTLDRDFSKLFFELSSQSDSCDKFLTNLLPRLRRALACSSLAIVRAEKGRWQVLASSGEDSPPPELLSDALDEEQLVSNDEWFAAPLPGRSHARDLLAVCQRQPRDDDLAETIDTLAGMLAKSIATVQMREERGRRIERLEAILLMAGQWNQTHETDVLLQQMAETSCRLLRSERASIFLWDRAHKVLVARPALGVDSGELRIPDDTGIVGQVIHSGVPRRVDVDIEAEQKEVDRRVDKELNYETKSLLCVPLRGKGGELFGAFEMINKIGGNFTDDDEAALTELATHAAIALENTQQYEQMLRSRNQVANQAAEGVQLIGECPAIGALRSTIRRVADTDLAILILGENGTGKEVVSQMLHYLSSRRNEPLIAVNCAAITETLLESELFGHEKGAFTDAHTARAGKFELASGGTLFLDEIGDMSLSGQAQLLRVLEEKIVVRVGGSRPIHTDARVFAATNQNLAEMVRAGTFREDLYYRLNVVTLDLPPMRERGEDVLLLAEHFLQAFCAAARRRAPRFTAAAKKRLLGHPWPGNVRELRNLMERLAYLSLGDKVDSDELAFILSPDPDSPGMMPMDLQLTDATKQFQIQYIKKHIERARGNMTDAAHNLGLHRSNLYRKMRQLSMPTSGDEQQPE